MKKKLIGCIMFGLLMCISTTTAFAGTWEESGPSFDREWSYKKDNGSYAQSEWIYYNNSWYYFDRNGSMMMNDFKNIGGYRYYFYDSGEMGSGFIRNLTGNLSDSWMFADKDGHIVQGLFMVDGVLYEAFPDDGLISNSTYDRYIVIYNEDYSKYVASANSNKYKDLYSINTIYDHGKILDKDGKPFAADSKIFTQAKYIPKYDSQGNLIGAIQNPNGYTIQ